MEKLKELFDAYNKYLIGIIALHCICFGCYKWGYHNGAKVNNSELAEYLAIYKREVNDAKARIEQLEATNKRITETNRNLEATIEATERTVYKASNTTDRLTRNADEIIGAIEGVIEQMRQATKTE